MKNSLFLCSSVRVLQNMNIELLLVDGLDAVGYGRILGLKDAIG
jgi:hypothetical protein